MSLFLLAAAAATAASVSYFVSRRGKPQTEKREGDLDDPATKGVKKAEVAVDKAASPATRAVKRDSTARKKISPYDGLPLALGDVVSVDHEERWLAGAIIARDDDRVTAVLFMAPEGAEQHAVAVFAPPNAEIFLLAPAKVDSTPEPPTTLEIRGVSLTRRSRLPVALAREGQGAPDLDPSGTFAIYEAGGRDVAVVVAAGGRSHAWVGRRYDEGEYDRMGVGSVD